MTCTACNDTRECPVGIYARCMVCEPVDQPKPVIRKSQTAYSESRMVPYVDPLAPEPANPYHHVDGYIIVDIPRKT